MPQVLALSYTISNETILRFTASQVLRCIRPLATKACLLSASPLSKILVLGIWRLLSLARPTSGFPILGLLTRFRWLFLARLVTFAQSRCSPTRVRTCLSSLYTVRRLPSPTTLSDGALLLASGMRYDERSAIKGLFTKLADGGRYAKYHPNMMLSMFHSMPDVHPAGAAPSCGVEESTFEEPD